VDGAQAVGHIPVSLRDLGCDVYGTSLHKWLMAPHGTGFLYVRREMIEKLWPLQPALDGLRADIRKFEEVGTQPAAARAAIADALAFQRTIGLDRKAARLRYLTMRWVDALKPEPRIRILSSVEPGQTYGLAAVSIDGVNAATLVQPMLDTYRIVISAVVNQGMPGPVIDFSGLRVTPNIYTTPGEIDTFIEAVRAIIRR
jgi:isopenicillin-N epimerase